MEKKIILSLLVFSLLLINACAQTTVAPVKAPQKPAEVHIVSETSKIKIIEVEEEVEEPEEEIEIVKISAEVKELLGIADKKVKSLKYSYKGPETEDFFYDFFVKGNKIKYILSPDYSIIDTEEDGYDTIYLDVALKTAFAYCDNRKCYRSGKKADLDYGTRYISTPLDWLNKIETAEKTGEELIGKRSTWKLAANNFTIWIDTFFGVPLQVESAGYIYQFTKIVFNNVKDEDVTPKN